MTKLDALNIIQKRKHKLRQSLRSSYRQAKGFELYSYEIWALDELAYLISESKREDKIIEITQKLQKKFYNTSLDLHGKPSNMIFLMADQSIRKVLNDFYDFDV